MQIGELSVGKLYSTAMGEFLVTAFPELDEDRTRVLALCIAFEEDRLQREAITLKDATFGELFYDAYFLKRVQPRELDYRKANQNVHGEL